MSFCAIKIIFDSNLSFDKHISNLSKACYYHIRDLRHIRTTLDFDTTRIIATSLVHSKLDYCKSLYYNLPQSQLKRLQAIQNSLARCVTFSSRFQHIIPGLKSLHWFKVEQRIQYKLISLTYSSGRLALTRGPFHKRLKTHLFSKSYPP